MDNVQIDLVAVLIAAIVSVVIGSLWYSKWLFGDLWLKLSDRTRESMKKTNMGLATLWSFIAALVTAYLLAYFEGAMGVTTVSDGMMVGWLAWLGFVATSKVSGVIWCNMSFKLFLIVAGQYLLSYLVMSGIVAA